MKKLFTLFSLIVLFVAGITVSAHAQMVNGTVTDAGTNEPLIGATVVAQGTTTGVVTDIDGKYQINMPEGVGIIVVSYTGYATQMVTVSGGTVNVAMSAGALMDEVVVVGYGTVRKRDLTGAVASLKEEDFNQGVVISADQLLQGRVPGVNIINNSGQPGGAATVKIRGNNSIRSGADPLYVIDGIPLDGRTAKASLLSSDIGNIENSNPLNFLNPSDIASIEVLKDASSAAIYGARASNGVILITTKKATKGAPQVNFNTSFGSSSILKKYDVLTGDEYRSALTSYGLEGNGGASVDAMDEILQNGLTQNYNLSVGTSGDNGSARFSAGIQDVQGIIKESGIKRYTASLNASYNILDGRAGMDVLAITSHAKEEIVPISTNAGFTGNLVGQALQWNPTIPLMTDGDFTTATNNSTSATVGATTINPLQMLSAHTENANTTTVLGSISPYINFTDNLQYRYRYGVNYGSGTTRGMIGKDINVQNIEGLGLAGFANTELISNLHTHTLGYNSDQGGDFTYSAIIGYEYQKFDFSGVAFAGTGFDDVPDGFDLTYALQNSDNANRNVVSFADPIVELQSYFGRANFAYQGKYMLTATVRADGSTKFGDNNKYGIFPSFSMGWSLDQESFLSDVGAIDQMKLRLGWGVTGNQEFPAGAAEDRYGLAANGGLFQENIGNPDLQWEQSSTLNVGVDFGLFDYKVSGSLDYYNRVTSNLLLDPFIQEPGPPVRAWKNIDGELVNSGVELGLSTFIVSNDKLEVTLGANIALLQNELRNYTGPEILTGDLFGQGSSGAFVQKHVNGMPLNTYFVRDYQGLDENGTSIYANDGALIEAGDPNANTILGLNVGVSAGDISFNMNWNGAYGHWLYNNTKMSVIPIGNLGTRNVDASLIGDTQESVANAISSSSRYLEKGNFTKLANATLAYNLGDVSLLKDVRISLTGQNLLVITDYSGFDPEVNTVNLRNGVPSSGIEYIPYPSARTILLGINVSF